MATPIRSIPVLTSKVAENFVRNAKKTYEHKRHTVDFSKQAQDARQILKKAKMKQLLDF